MTKPVDLDGIRKFVEVGQRMAFKPEGLQDALEFRTIGYHVIIKMADEIERLRRPSPSEDLPCDVMVAPATIIRKGCKVETLMLAISRRQGKPSDVVTWATPPRQASPSEDLVRALEEVRQELWVDYCLGMGRTDCDPKPFAAKPHIRIIDTALLSHRKTTDDNSKQS